MSIGVQNIENWGNPQLKKLIPKIRVSLQFYVKYSIINIY